jgi:hypothetical protein
MRRLILVTLGAVLLAGSAPARPILEDVISEKFEVPGPTTLRIRNTDGTIRIYGADTNEVKLEALKRSYDADRLKQISVKVTQAPGQLTIETIYPPKPKWGFSDRSGTVEYTLVVPWSCDLSEVELANGEMLIDGMRGKKMRAHVGRGRLFAHNCFGNIDVSVGSGGLDLIYDWWEEGTFSVSGKVVDGNARGFLPVDASFHLVADANDGHVSSDFTDKDQRKAEGDRHVDTSVGEEPRAEVTLRTVNGSIRIKGTNR